MDPALYIVTAVTVILLAGVIITIISNKIKISEILFLLVLGILFGQLQYNGVPIFNFSSTFLLAVTIIAMSIIVFQGSSSFNIKEFDDLSFSSLKLMGIFIAFCLLVIGPLTALFFFPEFTSSTLILGLIFAALMSATDSPSMFILLKSKANKLLQILKIETIFNDATTILIPIVLLDLKNNLAKTSLLTTFFDQLNPFLLKIVAGIGAGVVVGVVVFKIMKKFYNEALSPLALIASALLAYILAENLSGNGAFAVAVLGLMFGNMYLQRKDTLTEISTVFSTILEILIFVLLGITTKLPSGFYFYIKAMLFYGVLIVVRYFAVTFSVSKKETPTKQRIFAALVMPKGIAVAVVILMFSVLKDPEMDVVLNLTVVFMLFSIIIATIVSRFSNRFFGEAQ